jgi:hypothetical protein
MNRKTLLQLTLVFGVAALFVLGFFWQWSRISDRPDVGFMGRVEVWVGAICVFAILSYLHSENVFYRLFEHILLGLGLGFTIANMTRQVLIAKWWEPMKAAFEAFYQGTYTGESWRDACLVFAGVFGLLWYFQYSKKYLWLSRITIGVTAGAGAGLAIKSESIRVLPQITSTFKNVVITGSMAPHLSPAGRIQLSIENLLFVVIVCCVLYYFFFSFRRDTRLAKAPANMGRFFLMISFGAFFGNTFMTRVVILIDRVSFLIHDWLMLLE